MRLVEVFVALVVGGLLVSGVWRSTAALRADLAVVSERASETGARRVVGLILDQEAAGFTADPELPGDLPVRADRWWGRVCDTVPRPGRATLQLRGLRQPDPDKDSLVLVSVTGQLERRELEAVRSVDHCDDGAVEVAWTPLPGEEPPLLVRGYERGVYRLDHAFRYRRGLGGAQPLTAEVFHPDSLVLEVDSGEVALRWGERPARRWTRRDR